MSRMEIYCEVLCETFPLPKEALMGQLRLFVDRNGRWRRYFETQMSKAEECELEQKLRERRVGLLAWLLDCGAVSSGSLQKSVA